MEKIKEEYPDCKVTLEPGSGGIFTVTAQKEEGATCPVVFCKAEQNIASIHDVKEEDVVMHIKLHAAIKDLVEEVPGVDDLPKSDRSCDDAKSSS